MSNTTGDNYYWGKLIIGIIGIGSYISMCIGIIMILAQLVGLIHLSWISVLLPIIIPLAVDTILSILLGIVMIIVIIGDKRKNAKKEKVWD